MNTAKEIFKKILGFEVDFEDLPQMASHIYSKTYELDNEQVEILKDALPEKFQEANEEFFEVLKKYEQNEEDKEPIFFITVEQNWIYRTKNKFTHTVGINSIEIYIMNQFMTEIIYILTASEEVDAADLD